jgi:hypothetical protein
MVFGHERAAAGSRGRRLSAVATDYHFIALIAHLADMPTAPAFVLFWTIADKGGFWREIVCPLMTQSDIDGPSSVLVFAGTMPGL